MPATVTPPYLYAAGWTSTSEDNTTGNLQTTWRCVDTNTGLLVEVVMVTPVLSPNNPLNQAAWDSIFGDAANAIAVLTGGSAPTVDPVVIP